MVKILAVIRKYISCLFILIKIIVIYVSGCIYDKIEITIGLDNTTDRVVQYPSGKTDVINFGFDLRLSPKEEARIYGLFSQYLGEETGRTFKIHFIQDYACTVDKLSESVPWFAVNCGPGYISTHNKYNATCLAIGLCGECRVEYRTDIITQPDSDIYEIEDTRSWSFYFSLTYSTQGYTLLRKMPEDINKLLSGIGEYTYYALHVETVNAVIAGEYDACGVQDTLARSLISEGLVRIVAYSTYYPSCGISANKDMDPEIPEAEKAVGQVKEKLGNSRVDLSIVYSSIEYDHRELVDAVRKATNNAQLILIVISRKSAVRRFIGASSPGEFTEKRVKSGSVAVDRFKKVLPHVPMLGWEAYVEIRPEPWQFSGFYNNT